MTSHEVAFTSDFRFSEESTVLSSSLASRSVQQTVSETGELVPLMLHDIRSLALNSSYDNRVISKSELIKDCFKDGVLENSYIHSPVFISDIRPEYLYFDPEVSIPKKISKFISPDENNISDDWSKSGYGMSGIEKPIVQSQSWTEWALELIGWY